MRDDLDRLLRDLRRDGVTHVVRNGMLYRIEQDDHDRAPYLLKLGAYESPELPQAQLDVIHELLLRGLAETDPGDREYGAAYDAFVEAAGYPLRIGDQPDRVRELWEELIGDA